MPETLAYRGGDGSVTWTPYPIDTLLVWAVLLMVAGVPTAVRVYWVLRGVAGWLCLCIAAALVGGGEPLTGVSIATGLALWWRAYSGRAR